MDVEKKGWLPTPIAWAVLILAFVLGVCAVTYLMNLR